jgi:hypothetical protein
MTTGPTVSIPHDGDLPYTGRVDEAVAIVVPVLILLACLLSLWLLKLDDFLWAARDKRRSAVMKQVHWAK